MAQKRTAKELQVLGQENQGLREEKISLLVKIDELKDLATELDEALSGLADAANDIIAAIERNDKKDELTKFTGRLIDKLELAKEVLDLSGDRQNLPHPLAEDQS